MTESKLIEACIRRDRVAQKILYDRYARAMYTTAVRMLNQPALAAEAMQDAFLKVFQHLDSFEGRSSLGAWIKRIVVREALTTLRRQKPAFDDLNDQMMQEEVIDWGHTPIDAEYLEQAIAGLPDGFRTVFLLAEVEGYSHKEIAALLQVSEGTSKSQLWAAKKRLRSLLAPFSASNSTLA